MRFIVLGGGTAGHMAAVHMTAEFPEAELIHIFDTRKPKIGVGESTTPNVPVWLERIAGLNQDELRLRSDATVKRGGRFENWGTHFPQFVHHFQPPPETAYHLDANKLVTVLAERIRGQRIDAHVAQVARQSESLCVTLEDGTEVKGDFVLDARGFPSTSELDSDTLSLDWIPTNAALVQFSTPVNCPEVTRNVARSHGWVFFIPLGDHTSVGYIYNDKISDRQEVEEDLDVLLAEEGGRPITPRRQLLFPNFVRNTVFDGARMYVGNAASFTEPLEALSIGTVVFQLRAFTQWVKNGRTQERLPGFNRGLQAFVLRNSVFLSWHYAAGSRFDTRFWDHARTCFEQAQKHPILRQDMVSFERFVGAARETPVHDLAEVTSREQWVKDIFPRLRLYQPYGNFSQLNFAQVGRGIGYFE